MIVPAEFVCLRDVSATVPQPTLPPYTCSLLACVGLSVERGVRFSCWRCASTPLLRLRCTDRRYPCRLPHESDATVATFELHAAGRGRDPRCSSHLLRHPCLHPRGSNPRQKSRWEQPAQPWRTRRDLCGPGAPSPQATSPARSPSPSRASPLPCRTQEKRHRTTEPCVSSLLYVFCTFFASVRVILPPPHPSLTFFLYSDSLHYLCIYDV